MKYRKNQSIWVIPFVIQALFIASCSEKTDEKQTSQIADKKSASEISSISDTVKTVNFTVAAMEDASYSVGGKRVVRITYRIKVEKQITDNEIRAICQKIISQERSKEPHNAIAFFFYLPDSDIKGAYTAGKAEWTPFGKWERAKDVDTGDYSNHQLIVKSGNPLGNVPTSAIVDIPLEKKKKIYYELVTLQDQGMNAEKSEKIIAKKYNITHEQISKISIEAAINGWPMPPAK
jgi:hypothetical protein